MTPIGVARVKNILSGRWTFKEGTYISYLSFHFISFIYSHHCRYQIYSQLYGSTTVVMAIYGLHWKWRSLTPCQRHPGEPIEKKIFSTVDNVIDLNNLAKFGFGKIFRDWGIYTQHMMGLCFFYALRHAHSLNGWTDFDAQYLKRRRLVRGGAFSMLEKNRFLTLTFKRSKSAILFGLQNFDRHYLENGTR